MATHCHVDQRTLVRADWEAEQCEWSGASARLPPPAIPQHLSQKVEAEHRAYAERRSMRKRMSMAVAKIGAYTAAHEACERRSPLLPGIERILSAEFATQLPEWLESKDQHGRTPWHILCSNPSLVAEALKPLSLRTTTGLSVVDAAGRTALHAICRNEALSGAELTRCLQGASRTEGSLFLKASKDLLAAQDKHGQTALHCLCQRKDVHAALPAMRLLVQYDDSSAMASTQNEDSCFPLHCFLKQANNMSARSVNAILAVLAPLSKAALLYHDPGVSWFATLAKGFAFAALDCVCARLLRSGNFDRTAAHTVANRSDVKSTMLDSILSTCPVAGLSSDLYGSTAFHYLMSSFSSGTDAVEAGMVTKAFMRHTGKVLCSTVDGSGQVPMRRLI